MPQVVAMCVGDSITLGQTALRGGWRRLLNDAAPNLCMVGANNYDVPAGGGTVGQHEGYGGWYVASHVGSGTAGRVDTFAPALVILMLGTNDLVYDGLGSVGATLANVLAYAETLAAKASVKWLIACNIAQTPSGYAYYAATNSFRAAFASTFAGASSKISTCDPWSATTNPGADFADDIHPTEAGHAKAMLPILAEIRRRGIQTDLDRLTVPTGMARPGYG